MNNKDIIEILHNCNAISTGSFMLSSGIKSSFYIDIKKVCTDPHSLKVISQIISSVIRTIYKNSNKKLIIGGIELGSVPIATGVSLESMLPLLIIRKSTKEYGIKSQYIGSFTKNEEIILVEDVTTTGNSVKKAIESIRNSGGIVNTVIVVFDRGSNTQDYLKEININLISLITLNDLIKDRSFIYE